MSFKRDLTKELNAWKTSLRRKPLIIRGARQVGKTTLIRQFGISYKHFVELNLERAADIQNFQTHTDAKSIVDSLLLSRNIQSSEINQTLLFIDEIQESPEAIAMLRYFYEDLPKLHVIAAGSLLEHAMRKVKSFPVGRVEYRYLFPLNFEEFLQARGQTLAIEQLNTTPIESFAHQTLLQLFHEYAIIGGMPEVIRTYLETGNLADLPIVYDSIWSTYKDDVEKYASNDSSAKVIKHIINSAHLYVDQRIKFEKFGKSNYRSREVGEAMRNLDDAKILQLIYPTSDIDSPIKTDIRKSPRLQFLDTGLLNYELSIQAEMLAMNDLSYAYKGAVIPHMITQEVISQNVSSYKKPHFWVREKNQSSSEVDLVIQHGSKLIPIEIKSGKEGKLRSLHEFIDRSDQTLAIRMYAGKFSIEKHRTPNQKKSYTLMNLPYYLGTQLKAYIAHWA